MAYNTFPSYGQYPMYPTNSFGQSYAQPQQAQYGQSYGTSYAMPQNDTMMGIRWVDGEIGAKAFQMPPMWPANTPLPLWDTNDTVIYLKSINQVGMPNPLQKIHYTMEETPKAPMMHNTTSGQAALPSPDRTSGNSMAGYATKDDLEKMKEDIRASMVEAVSQSMQSGAGQGGAKKGAKTE